jgi:hypothetical protein
VRIAPRNASRCATLGAAAVLLGGCGGSSSSAPSEIARFAAQADAICAKANARIVALPVPAGGAEQAASPELASAARLLAAEMPIAADELAGLRRLSPPSDERDAFEEYVHTAALQVAAAGRAHAAAAAGDQVGFHRAVSELSGLSPQSDETASRVHLVDCARTVEPQGG